MRPEKKKRIIRQCYKYLDRIEYILRDVERKLIQKHGDPKLKVTEMKAPEKVSTC